MSVNYGSKRIVVGGHYGLRDWLVQRITAVLQLIFAKGEIGYELWAGIFAAQWMKFVTFGVIVALAWHVWVGVRNVWMDYVKSVGLRLTLHVATLIWLVGCAGWAFQVLWRL